MAVSGPFNRVVNIPGLAYSNRTWYRQKPLSDAPLTYDMLRYHKVMASGDPDVADYSAWSTSALGDSALLPLKDQLYQKAYGRMKAMTSTVTAQLGADIAERKQSFNAITAHVVRLTRAARALKRGRVLDFFKELGIKKRSWRTSASDMGGVWLEYSYGWKPLLEDMHNAVERMRQPFPKHQVVRGRAKGSYRSFVYTTYAPPLYQSTEMNWLLKLQLQCEVAVSNEDVWRANELGLTNPLSVAWEVVPFSFVVDWFVPIGNYLQNLTDYWGMDRKNSFTTWLGVLDRKKLKLGYNAVYGAQYNLDYSRWSRRAEMTRRLSLAAPPKLIPRFTGFYSARGANAIALLTQTLRDLPAVRVNKRPSKANWNMFNWDTTVVR